MLNRVDELEEAKRSFLKRCRQYVKKGVCEEPLRKKRRVKSFEWLLQKRKANAETGTANAGASPQECRYV